MYKIDPKRKIKFIEEAEGHLKRSLTACDLCPRNCRVNRQQGEKGYCQSTDTIKIYSYGSHHGEEPPLSGSNGSGTIFFSRCNMGCKYCQNHKFSQNDEGEEISKKELANIILTLQKEGCHNINFVTPTHFIPGILGALRYAYVKGLKIPVVYNTGGYDSFHVIKSLKGIVDIYLADARYSDDSMSKKYSNAKGYVQNNREIIKEMYSQTGDVLVENGTAKRGLIIRLLVLPNNISGTKNTLKFISKDVSKNIFLSVMSQFHPVYESKKYEELSRRINQKEYENVIKKMEELELKNGWIQPLENDFDEDYLGAKFLNRGCI